MTVIIFEGIATSGKSTLIKILQENTLVGRKVTVFTEEQTHEPIMKDISDTNVPFFKSLLTKVDEDSDVVIFDRLYLTQAFRAKIDLATYADIEQSLSRYSAVTIFLKVDESAIAERVMKAAEHRQTSWGDYIRTKGRTVEEIAEYYIGQQRSQLQLLEQSRLPHHTLDTTNHEYDKLAEEIKKIVNL